MTDDFELRYYQTVCQIQDDCIKDKISKKECEQKLEIERLKFIEYLKIKNKHIILEKKNQEMIQHFFDELKKR